MKDYLEQGDIMVDVADQELFLVLTDPYDSKNTFASSPRIVVITPRGKMVDVTADKNHWAVYYRIVPLER